MAKGVELIAEERKRQIEKEGFDAKHDSQEDLGVMIKAALYYANIALYVKNYDCDERQIKLIKESMWSHHRWPVAWDKKWCKPSIDPIRNLTKAGALIAACIDKIQNESEQGCTKKGE